MKPGGTVEVIEEGLVPFLQAICWSVLNICIDAIFPILPRWFTEPLHARTRWPSVSMQDGTKFFSNPQGTSNPELEHEYELLEILFNKVFERRFVNTKPTCENACYTSLSCHAETATP